MFKIRPRTSQAPYNHIGLSGFACRWRRSGLTGLVSLKGVRRVVIRQLRMLGIVGFPIPIYDAQTGKWQMRKSSASG